MCVHFIIPFIEAYHKITDLFCMGGLDLKANMVLVCGRELEKRENLCKHENMQTSHRKSEREIEPKTFLLCFFFVWTQFLSLKPLSTCLLLNSAGKY